MLVLVVSMALRWGTRHAVAVACAPLFSDIPIVAVALLTLGQLPPAVISALGIVGGGVLIVLGWGTVRTARSAAVQVDGSAALPSIWSAWRQGIIVNLVNPHPWLAWITAFGPLTVRTWRDSRPAAVLLLVGFYGALVGAKVLIAVLISGSRHRLTPRRYRIAVAASGVLLAGLGVFMTVEFALAFAADGTAEVSNVMGSQP